MKPAIKSAAVSAPRSPGAFMPDGSYNPDADLSARGPADRFVRAMVASRNGPLFTPELAAGSIALAKQERAFPNHAQWAAVHERVGSAAVWPFVACSTSAEEAVKRCGRGAGDPEKDPRHWCGESFLAADEKTCASPAHRRGGDPSSVMALVDSIIAGAPAPTAPAPPQPEREPLWLTEEQVARAREEAAELRASGSSDPDEEVIL